MDFLAQIVDWKKLLRNRLVVGGGITFAALVFAWLLSNLQTFENLDLKAYDTAFRFRGALDVSDSDIVIVAIDDQTFASLPARWPYPRSYYARAILNLAGAGARLIIVDVEFLEEDLVDPRRDKVLAAAVLHAGNVILAGKWVREVARGGTVNTYLDKPIAPLLNTGSRWGLVNVLEDSDGFVRRYLVGLQVGDKLHYPLAMEAFLALQGSTDGKSDRYSNGDLRLGETAIRLYGKRSFLINYRGPAQTFPTYSFSTVLDDSNFDLPEEEDTDIFDLHREWGTFKDKIVFIGAAAEELQDNKFTPFFDYRGERRKTPGVEVHANALSTLLAGDFIQRVSGWTILLAMVFMALLAWLTTKKLRPVKAVLVIVVVALGFVLSSFYLFSSSELWLPVTLPLTTLVLAYVGHVVDLTVLEQRERRRVKKTFQHYVASNVVDKMLDSGELPQFGGERRELTVLFSDIRGFTTFSEKRKPEEVVQNLSEYLTSMVDIIFAHQGTLDKFVGDEIMALFGAPLYYPDHAEKACETAIEMVAKLRELQKRWSAEKKDYFQIGIGINTGKMIVGNLGSAQLFDYTVIGDEVNLAARLEGTNKHYATTVIISESTYEQVKDKAIVRELDMVRVKGKKKPVRIFELRGMGSIPQFEEDLLVNVYNQGLAHYKRREWYQALTEFKRVLRYFPSDGPARVYVKRCLDFLEEPPPPDWDGVYEFKTK
jgi:adenylate cyclase